MAECLCSSSHLLQSPPLYIKVINKQHPIQSFLPNSMYFQDFIIFSKNQTDDSVFYELNHLRQLSIN